MLVGESDLPDCGPPASFSVPVHLASSIVTPTGSVHKSNGAYMSTIEEMMCVLSVTEGLSGDGCDLAYTLCKYDLRKGDLFVLGWARVRRLWW